MIKGAKVINNQGKLPNANYTGKLALQGIRIEHSYPN